MVYKSCLCSCVMQVLFWLSSMTIATFYCNSVFHYGFFRNKTDTDSLCFVEWSKYTGLLYEVDYIIYIVSESTWIKIVCKRDILLGMS